MSEKYHLESGRNITYKLSPHKYEALPLFVNQDHGTLPTQCATVGTQFNARNKPSCGSSIQKFYGMIYHN